MLKFAFPVIIALKKTSFCRNTPVEFKIAILYLNLLEARRYETLVGVSCFLLKQSSLCSVNQNSTY